MSQAPSGRDRNFQYLSMKLASLLPARFRQGQEGVSSVLTSKNLQFPWGDMMDAHRTGVSMCTLEGRGSVHRGTHIKA